MNNPTLGLCCEAMKGRADIEESNNSFFKNKKLNEITALLAF